MAARTLDLHTSSAIPDEQLYRFARFLIVGLLNTAFGYGVFAALYVLTGHHRPAIVLATIVGVVFNFFTTGRLVFRNDRAEIFTRFVAAYAVICGLNILLVDFLAVLGLRPLLAQLCALPAVAVLAYGINDRIVFGRSP